MNYQLAGVPLIILAGKNYGTGSPRDWVAKGQAMLVCYISFVLMVITDALLIVTDVSLWVGVSRTRSI